MKTIAKIIVFCAFICLSYSLCNTCSAITNTACVDNDKFSVCVNGIPSTSGVTQCPAGYLCTPTSAICSPEGTIAGSCLRCGTCSDNNAFACTGYNTFALCYGTTIPSSVNFTCSGTLVCNVDDPRICVNPAVTGIGATCPSTSPTVTTTSTTTTVSPIFDPQAYCASLGSRGRYEIPTDPFCKTYVSCALFNSTWIGNIYQCPGSTLFDPISGYCGVAVPQRCA